MLAAAPPRAPRCGPRPAPGPGLASSRAPHAHPGPAAAPPVLCYSRGRGRRGRSESKPGWIPEPLRDRPAPAGFRRRGLGLCPKSPAWLPRARPVPTARRVLGPRQPAPGCPLAGSAPPARSRDQALRPQCSQAQRPHSQALRGCELSPYSPFPATRPPYPVFGHSPGRGLGLQPLWRLRKSEAVRWLPGPGVLLVSTFWWPGDYGGKTGWRHVPAYYLGRGWTSGARARWSLRAPEVSFERTEVGHQPAVGEGALIPGNPSCSG